MLVLQSKRKRIEDTTKMYSKLRNSFDFLISLLSDKSMWQVLDMFFTSKSKIGFSFKEKLGVSHILKDREQAEK